MNALVIGTVSRLALAVVRGLGIKGVKVYTADSLRFTRCRFSRYSLGHFVYTSPVEDKAAFLKDVRDLIDLTGARVLFPADDDIYYFVARHKGDFDYVGLIPIPDIEKIERVKSKEGVLRISQDLGVRTPETWPIYDIDIILSGLDRYAYPVVIKPSDRIDGRRVFFAKNKKVLEETVIKHKELFKGKRYLIQRYIEGEHLGAAYIYNNGMPVCNIIYRQLHQMPLSGGVPTLTESCKSAEISRILENVLDSLNWHGVCQADFIICRDTGDAYLIDINPRLFSSLFQTIASGVNFPQILYDMAIGEIAGVSVQYKEGVRNLWVEGEIARVISYISGIHERRPDLLKGIMGSRSIEDFALGDPLPFILMPLCFVYKRLSGRCRPV